MTSLFAADIYLATGPEVPWVELFAAVAFLVGALTGLFFWAKEKFFPATKLKDGEDH